MPSAAYDAALKNRQYDKDGRLHILRTRISKATVNPYYGREIPGAEILGLVPDRVYYLLRDQSELKRAAASFARVPLMFKHIAVSADDPHQEQIAGTVGSDVYFESPYLIADLSVWDSEAIAGIETDTVRELSCSYHYTADMTPGTFEGQPYDGVMRNISGNHVALVESGRAGPDVMAADAKSTANLDVKITNIQPRQVEQFKKLFAWMNRLGGIGASRSFKVFYDGDGSARARILVDGEEPQLTEAEKDRDENIYLGFDGLETEMKETKFGKLIYAILCAASPKLAKDESLKPMVIGLTPQTLDTAALEPKLLAMDAEMKAPTLAAMAAAKDAAEPDDKQEDDEQGKAKDCKVCGAKDGKHAKDCKAMEGKKAKDEQGKENDPDPEPKEAKDKGKKAKDKSMASDEELKAAMDEFKAELREAEDARRAVRPVVGDVIAQDSAAEIYGFALDQMKIDRAGVEGVPALRALFNLAVSESKKKTPTRPAFDALGDMAEKFPNASRQLRTM